MHRIEREMVQPLRVGTVRYVAFATTKNQFLNLEKELDLLMVS
jgi:hypothetical protein